nr:hypothetical protein [Arthrobacter sp. fls2-241-R2A-200]
MRKDIDDDTVLLAQGSGHVGNVLAFLGAQIRFAVLAGPPPAAVHRRHTNATPRIPT